VFGLTLAAVGFYLAFRPVPETERERDEITVEARHLTDETALEPTDPGRPVELSYGPAGSRQLVFEMRQGNGADTGTLQSRLAFVLTEEGLSPDQLDASVLPEDGEPALGLAWTFDRVAVSVRDDGGEVGRDIVDQVDRLLVGTRQVRGFDDIGVPLGAEWTSVTNPQVRETLALVRHAQTLLMPRLPRGPVNAGESWIYHLKADTVNPMGAGRLKGAVEVETVYRGNVSAEADRELAYIQRRFSIDGSFVREDRSAAETRLTLEGQGRGTALFDLETGQVVESRVTFQRLLTRGGQDGEASDAGQQVQRGTVKLYLGEGSAR
jgi:hypothetical protein